MRAVEAIAALVLEDIPTVDQMKIECVLMVQSPSAAEDLDNAQHDRKTALQDLGKALQYVCSVSIIDEPSNNDLQVMRVNCLAFPDALMPDTHFEDTRSSLARLEHAMIKKSPSPSPGHLEG